MFVRGLIPAVALVAALSIACGAARAFDDAKYPNWKGQWLRSTGVQWDSEQAGRRAASRPRSHPNIGRSMRRVWPSRRILAARTTTRRSAASRRGMPRAMRVRAVRVHHHARNDLYAARLHAGVPPHLYRRPRLAEDHADLLGTSIGKWLDVNGDGSYDMLEDRDPRLPRAARHREHRHSAAYGQPDVYQGADPPRSADKDDHRR